MVRKISRHSQRSALLGRSKRKLPGRQEGSSSAHSEDAVHNLHGLVAAWVGLGRDVLAAHNEAQSRRHVGHHVLGQVDAADGRRAAHAREVVGQAVGPHLEAVHNLQQGLLSEPCNFIGSGAEILLLPEMIAAKFCQR